MRGALMHTRTKSTQHSYVNIDNIMRFATLKIITNFIVAAAGDGHEHIVHLCKQQHGTANVDWAMADAAESGHEHIVQLCKEENGATNIDLHMACAARAGHVSVVRLCREEYGADDVANAIQNVE